MKPKLTNSTDRKPLIVEFVPSNVVKKHPQFPRVMWADVDLTSKVFPVTVFATRASAGYSGCAKPIRVLVVALDDDGQAPIAGALDVLNRCAEQGHKLGDNPARPFNAKQARELIRR